MEGGEGAAKRRTGTPTPVTAQDAPEQGLGRLTTGGERTQARTAWSDGREAGQDACKNYTVFTSNGKSAVVTQGFRPFFT